jgi:hypothetical protein
MGGSREEFPMGSGALLKKHPGDDGGSQQEEKKGGHAQPPGFPLGRPIPGGCNRMPFWCNHRPWTFLALQGLLVPLAIVVPDVRRRDLAIEHGGQ